MSTQRECLEQIREATIKGCRMIKEKAQNLISQELHNAYPNRLLANMGWECPKCGRIYGPNFPVCTRCNEIINQKEQQV